MWKCYTKAVSAAHILLTFLPASYDDLLLLNEQEEEVELEGESCGEEKKVGACVCVCVCEYMCVPACDRYVDA